MRAAAYSTTYDAETRTLRVSGGLDEAALDALRDDVAQASDDYSSSIVLDLSALTEFPSPAVAAVALAQHRAAQEHGRVRVVAARDSLAQRLLAAAAIPHRAT